MEFSSSLPPGRWISAPSLARGRDQGEGAGRGNHPPLPDPSPWPREGSHSFPLAQGMSFRFSPWGRERNVDPPPGQGQVFAILPCPQGVDVNLLPAPREEELKTSPCPQGVGFGGRERVQGMQGESAASPGEQTRRPLKTFCRQTLLKSMPLPRGKGSGGRGEGLNFLPWGRERE